MSARNLAGLLTPRSVAIIGASLNPDSVGQVVLANAATGNFVGPVFAVNPHRIEFSGATWVADVAELPQAPDLAIVMIPAAKLPQVIAQLGTLGTRLAVVISAGVTGALRQAMLDAARPHLLRIIGPNCVGLLVPRAGLNASFASIPAKPGRIALISQSGALVTSILDWAAARGIGFSALVSVGDMADVDLGDLITLFAADPGTDAILLYVEGVTNPRKFMAAADAATRIKPVVAIKAGRNAAANAAAKSHTGAMAGAYDVYRAAFARAGIVMVEALDDLFNAAEVLSVCHRVSGDRLAIATNGGGAGVLAVDALGGSLGRIAQLADGTIAALDARLPPGWSHGDPVDIVGDAHAERYRTAISAVLRDPGCDALLVMNCPTAVATPTETAQSVADAVATARSEGCAKPVLACWLGDSNTARARPILRKSGIPCLATPDAAVRGFGQLLAAHRARTRAARDLPLPAMRSMAVEVATTVFTKARSDARTLLNEVEAKAVLAAYGLPVVVTRKATTMADIPALCEGLSPPFALKIVSPSLTHKSDVGGVALGLPDVAAVMSAASAMHERISREHPEAALEGFAIEPMIVRAHAHELIVGIATDLTFGPLIMVGAGGKAVEVLRDRAIGLPPLDADQARAMIDETRISKMLVGYRDEPPANFEALIEVIQSLSKIAVELPNIVELDINPLLVDPGGAIALDARIVITADPASPSRLVFGFSDAERAAWQPGPAQVAAKA